MNLAIIIGHSAKHQGATLYNGMTEWSYHQDMVHKYLYSRLPLITDAFEVFWRRSDYPYAAAIANLGQQLEWFGADFAIELHINAFDGNSVILGHEYLYHGEEGNSFGRLWSDGLQEMGIHFRKAVNAEEGGRGASNLIALPCPSVLLEPCFGDVFHEDSSMILENPGDYASLIAETLWQFQEGK